MVLAHFSFLFLLSPSVLALLIMGDGWAILAHHPWLHEVSQIALSHVGVPFFSTFHEEVFNNYTWRLSFVF